MVRFGQVVVGPPGSGKTTYCLGMYQYLKAIGRDAAVVNLDPANHGEGLLYSPAVDIGELVSLEVGGLLFPTPLRPKADSRAVELLKKNSPFDLCCSCMQPLLQRFKLRDKKKPSCGIPTSCSTGSWLQGVMQEFELGPNGAMLYCLEYLEKNVDWLMEKLQRLGQKYLIFDFPGQVRILYVVRTVCSASPSH